MSDNAVERLCKAAERVESCCPADEATSRKIDALHDARLAASAWLSSHQHDREEILESLDGWRQRAETAEASQRSIAREALEAVKERLSAKFYGEPALPIPDAIVESKAEIDAQLSKLEKPQ